MLHVETVLHGRQNAHPKKHFKIEIETGVFHVYILGWAQETGGEVK
jgi:hypothetical protein